MMELEKTINRQDEELKALHQHTQELQETVMEHSAQFLVLNRRMEALRAPLREEEAHEFQGNMLTEGSMVSYGEISGDNDAAIVEDLQDDDVVTIHLADTQLVLTEGDASTYSVPHFTFRQVDDASSNPSCMFLIENKQGNMLSLRSASSGDLISMQRIASVHPGGFVATTRDGPDDSTSLQLLAQSDGTVRLIGPKRHHLITLPKDGDPLLATRSILPEAKGRFVLIKASMDF
jgi:hypothetical protein